MPANMSRIAQVKGMSTRQSLNRPRLGITRQFQRMELAEMRLNKSQTAGFDGPATTITNRRAIVGQPNTETRYGQERIFNKDCDVKYLLMQCLNADPTWKPSRYARKGWREHPILKGRDKAEGLLG